MIIITIIIIIISSSSSSLVRRCQEDGTPAEEVPAREGLRRPDLMLLLLLLWLCYKPTNVLNLIIW